MSSTNPEDKVIVSGLDRDRDRQIDRQIDRVELTVSCIWRFSWKQRVKEHGKYKENSIFFFEKIIFTLPSQYKTVVELWS